jgi:nucleotide-binding universal stress UspA family protein
LHQSRTDVRSRSLVDGGTHPAAFAGMSDHREPRFLGNHVHAPRVRRFRMVVGVDLSEYSDIVVERALDQAARHDAPELHLLAVRERRNPDAEDVKQALWERVYPALEAFNQHGRDWRARLHVRRGKPQEQIVMLAAELRADLLVVGQFGLHHPRAPRKSLINDILHQAVCPTLVVGMGDTSDSRQCPMCVALREETEGEDWWCHDHRASAKKTQHVSTPMTVWNNGRFAIERAA